MHYFDHRFSNALIDDRLREAEARRARLQQEDDNKGAGHRLGLMLITLGERLTAREAEAA